MNRNVKGRKYLILRVSLLVGFLMLTPGNAFVQAQGKTQEIVNSIDWKKGPTTGNLGGVAQIAVPAGFVFAESKDMAKFAELNQNPFGGDELGALLPENFSWFIIFQYDASGYVKDDEKDKLDAEAILKNIQASTLAANEERKRRGWQVLHVAGWEEPPFFDPNTKNLTWAIRAQSDTSRTINFNSRILGRSGVMSANLVVSPDGLRAAVPAYKGLLTGFSYVSGQNYSEFRAGDKVATYGLSALIAGGAAAVAAKSGLLAKFGKAIIVAIIAVAGAIGAAIKKIFGKGEASATN